jgi:transcription antitermination factor NusG
MYGSIMSKASNASGAFQLELPMVPPGDAMCDPEFRWYAVWTRSRQEKAASAVLDLLGVQHYVPLKSELRQWSDRKQIVETPIFSGYLFVRMNLVREGQLQVLKAPGVVAFVGNKNGPLPIPDQEIADIRTVLAAKVGFSIYPSLKKGDRVRVVRGALAGVEGTLVTDASTSRLLVSVEMIRQSLALSVSREDLELIAPIQVPHAALDKHPVASEGFVEPSAGTPWRLISAMTHTST